MIKRFYTLLLLCFAFTAWVSARRMGHLKRKRNYEIIMGFSKLTTEYYELINVNKYNTN